MLVWTRFAFKLQEPEKNTVSLHHHIHLTAKLTFHIHVSHTNIIKHNTLLEISQWLPTFLWYKIRFLVSCLYFSETRSRDPEDCCVLLKSSVSVVLGAGGSVEAALNFNLLLTVGRQAAVGLRIPEERRRKTSNGTPENTHTHTHTHTLSVTVVLTNSDQPVWHQQTL